MGGTESEAGLKQYRAPWKGQLVLACGKCQKRMSRKGKSGRPFKLKAELKRALGGAARVRVLRIPCIKLCPRAGIAICTQAQFGRGECSIVTSSDDVRLLARNYLTRPAETQPAASAREQESSMASNHFEQIAP